MLRKLEVDYGKFLFIDFGCGKACGGNLIMSGLCEENG
jgi:hypothetical protein